MLFCSSKPAHSKDFSHEGARRDTKKRVDQPQISQMKKIGRAGSVCNRGLLKDFNRRVLALPQLRPLLNLRLPPLLPFVFIRVPSWAILLLLLVGCNAPSLLITPVRNTSALDEIQVMPGKGWAKEKIAIVEVEGMLANVQTGGLLGAGENPLSLFTQQLERAEKDASVKAVVLRINSPGGTVTTSDTMYEQVRQFRAKTKKPVVASSQEVMASGAYYVACGADKIVVHPTSVVGSIGVIFTTFEVEGGLKMLGIRTNTIKSGELKDMGSPLHAMSPLERAVIQNLVDEYFARFKGVVVDSRKLTNVDHITTATDGRVFSGAQAVALGLADQTGSLDDAITLAQQLAGTSNARVVLYKRPFGYSGSIYASTHAPTPRSDSNPFENIPGASQLFMPTGFYYVWKP